MEPQATTTQRFYSTIWPYAATVLRTAQALCHNLTDADDLAQETMLKAFRSLDQFSQGSNAKAWLMTILRHTHVDRIRSRALTAGKTVSLDAMVTDIADSTAAEICQESDWQNPRQMLEGFSDQQMLDALKKLPNDIRWTLLLVDIEGIDHADAAGVLGIPVGTVKSRVHRGHRMLRETLAPLAKELRVGTRN